MTARRNAMTAIAYTGTVGNQSSSSLFQIARIEAGPGSTGFMPSGIFCIGALTAPDGQFLHLSLIGRDTAFQELRGLMTTGKVRSFLIKQDEKQIGNGWFSHEWLGQMEYHGSKIQTALFGEVTQMILYHPLLTTPDKANQTVALPFLGHAGCDDHAVESLWNAIKHVCEVPLLDGWRDFVLELLMRLEWYNPLMGFNCNANYVKLGSNIGGLISANIRSGALCIEPDADGHYAFIDRLTLDLEFGLTSRYQQPSPTVNSDGDGGGGFWDDTDVIDCYSRAQAIADGVLVDVSAHKEIREAGFKVPVALTAAVWDRFVEWDNDDVRKEQQSLGQSTAGRLWDVMYMAFYAIRHSRVGGDVLFYDLHVIERDGFSTTPRGIRLKLHSGPGDHGEHVITIMLPEED
jgi:hypothetical protein